MTVQELVRQWSTGSNQRLHDVESKALLRSAGLAAVDTQTATSADEAAACAQSLGLPVVVKPLSRQGIPAQLPGRARSLASSEAEVRRAFDAVRAYVASWDPTAASGGVAVQKASPPGVELRIFVFQDPVLGATLAFSFGRQAADIWEDVAYRVVPLVAKDARLIVREPKAAKTLLGGYGVLPAPNVAYIEEALLKLSALVDSTPDLLEVEIDPAIAGRDGLVVEEARVTLRGRRGEG